MRLKFDINKAELNGFEASCQATINRVGNGSRKALVEACTIISEDSLAQVPRDTDTLANSQFWEVTGSYKIGWEAVIGYGGNGDPINPRTGKPASSYMLKVHEDLTAIHFIGKAKFLEDPVRDYTLSKHPRTIIRYVSEALEGKV